MKRIIISISLILANVPCLAQPPEIEWFHSYGGPGKEFVRDLQVLPDGYILGGVMGLGSTEVFGDDTTARPYLIRTNLQGDTLWTRRLPAPGWSVVEDILPTTDGNLLLSCQEYFSNNPYLVKTSLSGDTLWTKYFSDGQFKWPRGIAETTDGGFLLFVGGWIEGNFSGPWLVKINGIGETIWTHALDYPDSTAQAPHAVDIVNNGDGSYTAAAMWGSPTSSADALLLRISEDGDTLWTSKFFDLVVQDLEIASDGGYLIAGNTPFWDLDTGDLALIKTDSVGGLLWRYDGVPVFNPPSIAISVGGLPGGGSIATGMAGYHQIIMRFSAVGDFAWHYVLEDEGNFVVIRATPDGGYAVATRGVGGVEGVESIGLLKFGTETAVDQGLTTGVPIRFQISAYPNPFNPITTLTLSLTGTQDVQIGLYDITGRYVKDIAQQRMTAGEHSIQVDAAGLPSGVYFARAEAGTQTMTKKLVLLK
jgi:hypothetical protein